jgi:hypothetical protein
MRKDKKESEGFSSKEIQENFREESRRKPKPDLSYARSRQNLTDALDYGNIDLFLEALDAMGFVEGTPQREQALRVFRNKHGPYSR